MKGSASTTLLKPTSAFSEEQLRTIQLLIEQSLVAERERLVMQVLTAEPKRAREGQIFFADGTGWDPGKGAGLYEYTSGAYNKL